MTSNINNIDYIENSSIKLTQENLGSDKLQKGFMGLDVLHEKLKQERCYLSNFVEEDLILVGN